MKIRNKNTGQIFEVMPGTLFPRDFYEIVDKKTPANAEKARAPKKARKSTAKARKTKKKENKK